MNSQRRRQIDTLKIFNDNVIEIQSDEKYGIKFNSGGNNVTLIIELGPEFPNKTPKLTLEPLLIHPWVEDSGDIKNFPGLINFTINSDLGRVCQAIIREFEKRPPELATSPSVPVQSSIPELNVMDPRRLLELLNDEQCLDDFIEELTPIKTLNAELDSLIEETECLAKENLEKNSILSDLKANVESLSNEFLNLGVQYNQTNAKYEDKASEYSPQNIRQMLEIGMSSAESQCEETVDAFLEGNQSLNDFLDEFMIMKKLIATRKFKEERLAYQLSQCQEH